MAQYILPALFLLLLRWTPVSAQEVDTSYVQLFTSRDHLRTGLRYKDYQIRFSVPGTETFSFSNRSIGLLLGARKGKVGFGFTLPIRDLLAPFQDESKRYGLRLRFYPKRAYLQWSGQRIVGFQAEGHKEDGPTYRSDIRLWDFSLFGFRVANPNFSLRASFKNNPRQKRSQGSCLLAFHVQLQSLRADSIILQEENGVDFSIDRFQQMKWGVGVGYAHTWVFAPKWYCTPVLTLGPELRLLSYRKPIPESIDYVWRISPLITGRLAVGYNGDRHFTGMTINWLPGLSLNQQLNTRTRDLQIRFKYGYRLL